MVRAVADATAYRILAGKAEVRILFDAAISGQESAYLGAMTAQPGAVVPLHRHSASSEYLFVIEGEAEMSVAGRVIPVRAGDGIQIPPSVEHGVTISGGSAFKALQLYSPAGPEQRFKAGGK
jgi:putative monooxygenase